MEIATNVYLVEGIRGSNVYLLKDNELALIDTGMPGNADQILSFIKDLGRKPEEFLSILKRLDVDIVVDIRAWSIYPLYFYPKNMRKLLEENGFGYLRYKTLGNPSELRKQAGENFELAKQWYQEYIIKDLRAREAFVELYKRLRFRKNYCLICYCPTHDPKLCHRFWLKEMLINLKRKRLGFEGDFKLECRSQYRVHLEG